MIHALPALILTFLLVSEANADNPLCIAATDKGMTVTLKGQSPLGPGTSVVVYPDGIAVRTAPNQVTFIAQAVNGVWVSFSGNYIKGEMNLSGGRANGSDLIEIKGQDKGELKISRHAQPKKHENDPEPDLGYVLRVTRAGHGQGADIKTSVLFQTRGGADVATLTSSVPGGKQDAGVAARAALPDDRKKEEARERKDRSAQPPWGTTDFAEGQTYKSHAGCSDQVTDLTGQGGGDAKPGSPAAKGN